jgi:hypothetical protein
MNRRDLFAGGATALLLAGCDGYTVRRRFRLTLEVEAEGKTKSASSVVEGRIEVPESFWRSMATPQFYGSGDAVYLDLGRNRFVVATLYFHSPAVYREDGRLYTPAIDGLTGSPRLDQLPELVFGKNLKSDEHARATIPESLLPTFITFRNVNDVKSFQIIPPKDFSLVLGPDVRFQQMAIETTTDKITLEIKRNFHS